MSDEIKQSGINGKSKEIKKTKLLYTSIIFSAVVVLVIVFFLVPIHPGVKGSLSPKINQMKRLVAKIGNLETEVKEKQDELCDCLKTYIKKTGEPLSALNGLELSDEEKKILKDKIIKGEDVSMILALNGLGFSDEEKKILKDKISNEKDVSIKSLLEDILNKDKEISGLNDEMKKYEALLPQPHITNEKENHYQIAMDFLINGKKIKRERAHWLVERTALFDPLAPGFRVWNFLSAEEFGTFVTQGSADISPNHLRRMVEQYLLDARDKAIAEKEELAAEINELKSKRDQLASQVSDLRDEKQEMIKKLEYLDKQNLEMQRSLNSLSFMVDLEKNLAKKGIIKSPFLGIGSPKLKKMSPEYFKQKIDLRISNTIEINASQFSLNKIKEITIYPRFYKKGVDYKVRFKENKQKAILIIWSKEKFKSERVVISVE